MTCFDKRNCAFSIFHTVCCFLFCVVLHIILGCFFTEGGKKLGKNKPIVHNDRTKKKNLIVPTIFSSKY